MSPDDDAKLRKLDPVHQNAIVILQAMLDHQSKGDPRGQHVDPVVSAEACLMVAAALIEINPGTQTTRDLRVTIDQAAEGLRRTAKKMRAEYEVDGKHGLELLGAFDVWTERAN